MSNNTTNPNASAATTAQMLRFNDIAPGATFRWRSNLGGQDTMRKIGEHDVKNLVTGSIRRVGPETTYFGQADAVILL